MWTAATLRIFTLAGSRSLPSAALNLRTAATFIARFPARTRTLGPIPAEIRLSTRLSRALSALPTEIRPPLTRTPQALRA